MDSIENSSDGACNAQLEAKRRAPLFWTIGISVVIVAVGPIVTAYKIRAFASPETAMYGPAIYNAGTLFVLVFFSSFAVLFVMALVRLFTRGQRRLALIPLVAAVLVVVFLRSAGRALEEAPAFYNNFAMSEKELDGFAKLIRSGAHPSVPAKVGSFEIVRYESLESGALVLYTKERSLYDAKWGFVHCPNAVADTGRASIVGFQGETGEEHLVKRMNREWFVLYHLYWFIKRGWS